MQTNKFLLIPEIHPDFTLKKQSYSKDSLIQLAYTYCNEGEVYEQEVGRFLLDWFNGNAYIEVKTSGSTGVPKTIRIYKRQMVNSAVATGNFFEIQEKTTALLCLPAKYIAGKMMIVRAMVLGWQLDIVPPKTNPLDSINMHYDFCAMVPLQLDNSINRLNLLKKLIVGGGSVSESLKKQVQGVKTKIYETYGMTETVTHVAARMINPCKKDKKNIECFKALPDITLSTDDRNCLVIKAPQLNDKKIVTNDVVKIISVRKFYWKGRYDNVINSGGVKLYPEEIETKLQLLINQRFFITSIPDDVLGNKMVLVVEKSYDDTSKKESLFDVLKSNYTLEKYEIPKIIYFVSKFIETENGKIQRSKTLEVALSDL